MEGGGTSAASALISGFIALCLEIKGTMTKAELMKYLIKYKYTNRKKISLSEFNKLNFNYVKVLKALQDKNLKIKNRI